MMKSLRCLLRNKKGATAVEYGILVAAIAVALIFTVPWVVLKVNTAFVKGSQAMSVEGNE